MSESESSSLLHEFVEVDIHLAKKPDPTSEKALHAALDELDGVKDVRISESAVHVIYEPIKIVKAAIEDRLSKAGFQFEEVATGQSSPVLDAVSPHPSGEGTG